MSPIWAALPEPLRGVLSVVGGIDLPRDLPGVYRGRTRPRGPNPVLVSSWSDMQGVAPAPVVLVEHGSGQSYGEESGCYSGGAGRESAVLFIVPNRHAAERNLRRYPNIPNAVVGSPRLDRYHERRVGADTGRCDQTGPICVSFHWNDGAPSAPPERRSALPHYLDVLADVSSAFPGALGHAHPRAWPSLAGPLAARGFELVPRFDDVLARASVYVCENSSTIYEFASLDKPVVVLNAPWFRRDVDFWPRFWACADVGVQVDEPGDLVERIGWALEDSEAKRTNRRRAVADVYAAADGHATERAVAAIVQRLRELEQEEPVALPAEGYVPVRRAPDAPAPAYPDVPRLRRIGMSDEEIEQAIRTWQSFSEAERWAATDDMNALTDVELGERLREGRADPTGGETVPEGTVAELRAWIGDDPTRAEAALTAERLREVVRKGVTEHAQGILRG